MYLWKMVHEYQSLSSVIFGMARTSSSETEPIYGRTVQAQFIMSYDCFINQRSGGQVDQVRSLLAIQCVDSLGMNAIRKRKAQVRIDPCLSANTIYQSNFKGQYPGGGVDSHMKRSGMLVGSIRGIDQGFWSRLGCS